MESNVIEETQDHQFEKEPRTTNGLLDEPAFLHVLVANEGEPADFSLSTKLGLKYKRRKLYFPMDFGELTID